MFMITRTWRSRFTLATMLALALTSACSGNAPERADTVSVSTDDDQAEAEDTSSEISDAGGEVEAQASEPADEPADAPPAEPLATAEGQPPFASLEVIDLRRVGDTVTLEFAMISAESASTDAVRDLFAAPQDRWDSGNTPAAERRNSVSGVTLVDQVNRKRHLVLRDTDGACLCTRFEGYVDGDIRYPHSAQFPAPPEDVDQMTVQVPGFPAIDNVPLRVAN